MSLHVCERYFPLSDISVRSEGGERIIDAYAAAFGVQQEIHDREGHYMEELAPSSFDKTISQRSGKFQVLFNHGKTLHGVSSERYSQPYGVPIDIRPDGAGVFTSTRVSRTSLGDEMLTLAQDGALKGQSFSGRFMQTEKRDSGRADLKLHYRTEVALTEYGLTPFPYYEDARVVGIRSQADEMLATLTTEELTAHLLALPDDARADLLAALAAADTGTGNDDTTDTGLSPHHTRAYRERRLVLAGVIQP